MKNFKSGSRSRDRRDSPRRNFGGRDSRRPLQDNISDRSISQLIEKIGILNTKLDTIISLLSSAGKKKLDSAALTLVKEKNTE